ncbi:SLBB domain-containing protein [Spirosoma sp. BT702]|uniref:SLBB domain-containing protein n=1 Tax=Spirosoma profusum TaxID=2771354 RepID=A0A926Y0U0_9BACT|nr:SLBB domain-containing protein [Spirosoma profusum]MBD2704554.1 SLBB domain-containing protein [Spirosoma profusum]
MQNPSIYRDFPTKYFLSPPAFSSRWFRAGIVTILLSAACLITQAQIIPSTQGLPSGAGGRSLPAGVNPNNLPANVRQQLNQRNGSAGQNIQTAPDGRALADPADTTIQAKPDSVQLGNETEAERSQRLEKEATRRRLFGFSIFNDPNLKQTFTQNMNIATPRNYIIGPGDQLNIQLYGYTETDFSQKVSPDGNVYFAQGTGIGPVFVSGLSIEQAKVRLTERLSKRFVGLRKSSYGPQNTFLEVSLGGQIRSIRVTVTGDAVRPGTYTMSSLATVLNAVYLAGGPSELGSFRKVQLIRNNRVAATLDLYDYLLNGTQRNDIRLQDNDNIRFTTFIQHVEITGTVKRPNIFEMLPGETMERLLFYAGDFAAQAYKNRVKVSRLTDREIKVVDVTRSEFGTFAMQDGDLVTVERLLDRFENQVTIEGAVYRPGQYSLDNSPTLKQLITAAEGLKGDAFTGRVNIVRTRDDLALENITVNLANILAGTEADLPLQREDQIIVASRFDLTERATVSVQGEVNLVNTEIPYIVNMTLNDALLRSGGLKESAAASQVEVIRRKKDADPRSVSAQTAEVFRFNVNRDLSLSADDNKIVLEPFDQVVVRRSPNYFVQTYANVEGEVIIPGSYPIRSKDQKVSDMISQAGGLTPQAYIEGATLIRLVKLSPDEITRRKQAREDLADGLSTPQSTVETDTIAANSQESIGINLKKILAKPGSSEDIMVQEGDILRIPKLLETVRIQGEVLMPNTVKYRSGQNFQDYISNAGGFTAKSQRRRSFVIYANGSVDRTRKFMFFNVYPRVEPGAEIVIPKKTSVPLTAQQILNSTVGIAGSLLTLVTTILVITRVR